jgi:hypothetical protein
VPQRSIDFAVLGEAFRLLFANWKDYTMAGAALFAILIPVTILLVIMMFITEGQPETVATVVVVLLIFVFMIGAFVVQGCLAAGITNYTLQLTRHGVASMQDMWMGFKNPMPFTGAFFLSAVFTALGICACFLGTYVVAGILMFVWPAMIDKRLGPMDAIRESWNMLKDEWLMATVFLFVVQLCASIGMYACYIGFAVTYPLTFIAPALLYNRYVGHVPQAPPSVSPYPRSP